MASNCVRVFSVLICCIGFASFAWSEDTVSLQLDVTDLLGQPIDSIAVGEEFFLRATTQQVGGFHDFDGVFAAYMNVNYDATLASLDDTVPAFSSSYPNGKVYDLSTPGSLRTIGAFTNKRQLGRDELEFFTLKMTAATPGDLLFESAPVGSPTPLYEILVFSRDTSVAIEDVIFGNASLTVVPEPCANTLMCIASLGCWLTIRRQR